MTPAAVLSILVKTQGASAAAGELMAVDAAGKKASAAADQLEKSSVRSSKGYETLSSAAKVGGLAVAAGGALALNAAGDYEKSLNIFQAVSGATGKEMAKVSAIAKQLGSDVKLPGTSAADAAIAMTELAKGGLTVKESMAAARGVLQLSAAAGIENAEAATITARALSAFSLKGKDAARVTDLLAGASNASTAEITDVASGMQQAGASAAQLGIPIEDLTTALALMANKGIAGSDAGTSLKTMFSRLVPETDKQAKAMKKLGIDVFDNEGKFVGVRKAIEIYQRALGGMTKEQQAAALQTLFGADAQRAANIIMLGGAGAFDKMKAAVTKQGQAQALSEAKTKGFKGSLEAFKSTVETLAISFGQILLPAATKAMRFLSSAFSGLEGHKTLVLALVAAIGTLSITVLAVNAATKAWAAAQTVVMVATKAWTAAQAALNFTLLGFPVVAIIAGLIALGAALFIAYKKSETFRDIVNGAWTAIKSVAGPVISWLVGAVTDAWEWIKTATMNVWDAIDGVVIFVLKAIELYLKTYFAIFKAVITTAWDVIKTVTATLWDWFGPFLKAVWEGVKTATGIYFNAFKAVITTVWDVIKTVTTTLWDWFGPFIKLAFEIVKTAVTIYFQLYKALIVNAWNGIKTVTTALWDWFGPYLKAVWEAIETVAGAAWGLIKTAIINPIKTAKDEIGKIWDTIKDVAEKGWEKIKDAAGTFAVGLKDTISGAFRDAANLVVGFVNKIIDVVNKIPGVNVAKVQGLAEGGKYQGFARGGAFARTGGLVNSPITLMGEEAPRHPEFVIPTNPAYRKRAQGLAMQAAGAVGLKEGGIFGALSGIAGDLLSKGSGFLLDKLPGTDQLGWLKGLGAHVLGRVGEWIKDKVQGVVSGLLGGIDLPDGFTGGDRIARMVAAMNDIDARHLPYVYGGFSASSGYDCSGLVSAVLNAGGFNVGRLTTDGLKVFGESGDGNVITIGVRGSTGRNAHTMMKIGNRYLESGGSNGGAKWVNGWDGAFPIHRHPDGFAQGGVYEMLTRLLDPKVVGWGLAHGGQWGGSFANGGVVPGPAGAPRIIQAHGGETIWPAGQLPVIEVYIGGDKIDERVDVRIRENGRQTKGAYMAGRAR